MATTIENVEVNCLREALEQLTKAWANMMRLSPFSQALGSVRVQEITFNEIRSDLHPHVHTVLIARDLAHAEKMSSCLVEKFQRSAVLTYTPECASEAFPVTCGSELSRVPKYNLKRPSVEMMELLIANREQYIQFHLALSGRRLISTTGCFKKAHRVVRTESLLSFPPQNALGEGSITYPQSGVINRVLMVLSAVRPHPRPARSAVPATRTGGTGSHPRSSSQGTDSSYAKAPPAGPAPGSAEDRSSRRRNFRLKAAKVLSSRAPCASFTSSALGEKVREPKVVIVEPGKVSLRNAARRSPYRAQAQPLATLSRCSKLNDEDRHHASVPLPSRCGRGP
jgi:hypothetical protein